MEKHNQLGLIAYLAERLGPKNKLGRKAVQKFIHIASELGKVPTGYRFSFYTYGPYSRELAADLELSEAIEGISSMQDATTGAFDIKAGEAAKAIILHSKQYLDQQQSKLDQMFEIFGDYSARTLELYSTIIFLRSAEPGTANSKSEIRKRVQELKPKYTVSEIELAYEDLIRLEPQFNLS